MITRMYYVSCDDCGRPCGTHLSITSGDARRFAKSVGWLRIPRRSYAAGGSPGADYCPACAAKGDKS